MAKEEQQKFSAKGKLIGVEISEGNKSDGGTWKRAAISIQSDNKKTIVATFNTNDIDKANSLNGKEVEAIYTKNGKYNNLIEGGINTLEGQPITEEEVVSDVNQTKLPEKGTNNFNSQGQDTTPQNQKPAQEYWTEKEKKQYRGMCISYAKDLCVGGKVELKNIRKVADKLFQYVWEGRSE